MVNLLEQNIFNIGTYNASKKIMISKEDSESFCKVMTLVLSFLDFLAFFPVFW